MNQNVGTFTMEGSQKNEMTFEIYKKKYVDVIRMGDFRERMIQDFVIRPFIESLTEFDVIPTDIKVSNKNNRHNYGLYSGKIEPKNKKVEQALKEVTPDLCIAKDWKWDNQKKDKADYKATVEIKTPHHSSLSMYQYKYNNRTTRQRMHVLCKTNNCVVQFENKPPTLKIDEKELSGNLSLEMLAHLSVMDHVILTDGMGWHFFDIVQSSIVHKNVREFNVKHIYLCERIIGNINVDGINREGIIDLKGYEDENIFTELKKKIRDIIK